LGRHLLGNTNAQHHVYTADKDSDLSNEGGLPFFDHQFGRVRSGGVEFATFNSSISALSIPMVGSPFNPFEAAYTTHDVRYWCFWMFNSSQSSGAYASDVIYLDSSGSGSPGTGLLALESTFSGSGGSPANKHYLRLRVWDGSAWQNMTQGTTDADGTGTGLSDNSPYLLVVKCDLSGTQGGGSDAFVGLYTGDGTGSGMNTYVADEAINNTTIATIAQVASANKPHIELYLAGHGKQAAACGIGDYSPLEDEPATPANYNGYVWDGSNEERGFLWAPALDGDDEDWSPTGGPAACSGDSWRAVDDVLEADVTTNDYISATKGSPDKDALFKLDSDPSNTPDGVLLTLICPDSTKELDYNAHWKDEGGTKRQKAVKKGYVNGTNGTTFAAYLQTQDGTASGSAWTSSLKTNDAQFGVRLLTAASADGKVYAIAPTIVGNNLGGGSAQAVCAAAAGIRRRGLVV
jgi:hypothetical protein